jgi:hypothetical protein
MRLQGVNGFAVIALGSSVDSALEFVEFPLGLGPGDLLPVIHPGLIPGAHAGLAHGGDPTLILRGPRQRIRRLSRRPWLLGPSHPATPMRRTGCSIVERVWRVTSFPKTV